MRIIGLTTPVLAAFALMACEEQATVEAGAPDAGAAASDAPDDPGVTLGGVDIDGDVRLLGTEPFWGVDLTGSEIVYSGVDRPEQRAPRPEPVLQGTLATWTTETAAGDPLIVTLMETECSDGMSDRTYPLTARVEIAGETLSGCAASTEWIMTSGEGG